MSPSAVGLERADERGSGSAPDPELGLDVLGRGTSAVIVVQRLRPVARHAPSGARRKRPSHRHAAAYGEVDQRRPAGALNTLQPRIAAGTHWSQLLRQARLSDPLPTRGYAACRVTRPSGSAISRPGTPFRRRVHAPPRKRRSHVEHPPTMLSPVAMAAAHRLSYAHGDRLRSSRHPFAGFHLCADSADHGSGLPRIGVARRFRARLEAHGVRHASQAMRWLPTGKRMHLPGTLWF